MNISRRAYLRILGILPGVSFGWVSAGQASTTGVKEPGWEEPVPTGSTRVPVEDPHITLGHGTSYTYGTADGIPHLSRGELATEVLKLHPDFWNQRYITGMGGDPFFFSKSVPSTARDGMDLAASLELPASLGFEWMPRDVPLDERPANREMSGYLYDLPPEEQWPAPNGDPAEHPLHVSTARDLEGNVKTYHQIGESAAYCVSMYAPGPVDYHLTNHENAPLYGANSTEMDLAVDVSNLMTGDYSIWAKRAFREFLEGLPANRLDRLEIDNVSQFDIQSYTQTVRDEIHSGERTEEDAIQDPILFEFRLMENRRILELYTTYVKRGRASAEQVNSPLTTLGNQNTRIVASRSNAAIILSQVYDLVEMENPITIPDQEAGGEFYYLSSIRTSVHKLVAAIKRVLDKPVVEHGFYGTASWDGALDPTNRYPTLQTLNFAEVYANGSTRQLDLDGWNSLPPDEVSLMWLDPETGSVPDEIRPLADFLWLHKQDLQGTPRSDVAVVYSIPTLLGKIRPFIGRKGDQEAKSVDGWVKAAREKHIPTNLVIFGHPELWDDSDTLDRLSEYQTLIFPNISALTGAQYEATRKFVNNGGTVLAEGELGTHDGYYRSRTEDITELDGVLDAGDAGTQAANGDISAAGDAIEQSLQSPLVKVDAPPTLSCEVITTEDGWHNVHLVNYEYDSQSDSISEVSEVSVALLDSDEKVQDVDIIAPGIDRQPLNTERSGEYISVTVPEIAVWGIVRFKTSNRSSKATESEAEETIEDASAALEAVSATGRSIPIARGEAAVYEAQLAQESGQFDRAIKKAKEALEQTKPAQKELHIGIDSGHGQDPDRTYEGLKEFREKYAEKYGVKFSKVTDITPEQLAGLDGLLIGGALAWKGQEYTFSSKELATLERFVDAGGRVAVVVRDAVDEGINALTERFGITVDPRIIYTLDMWDTSSIRTEPAQHRTPITYQILEEGWMPGACSLTNLGENVTVQIQSKPNTVRKDSSEEKQFPVAALSKYGDGAMVVYASEKLLFELRFNFEVQARNILRYIGDSRTKIEVQDLTPDPTPTPTPTEVETDTTTANPTRSPTSTEVETDTTTANPTTPPSSMEDGTDTTTESATRTSGQSGFGVISALAGLVSALGYRLYQDHSKEE